MKTEESIRRALLKCGEKVMAYKDSLLKAAIVAQFTCICRNRGNFFMMQDPCSGIFTDSISAKARFVCMHDSVVDGWICFILTSYLWIHHWFRSKSNMSWDYWLPMLLDSLSRKISAVKKDNWPESLQTWVLHIRVEQPHWPTHPR